MAGANEVRAFQVTCPPGVAADAPQVTDLVMPVRQVTNIRVRVPPGPLSSMGFGIGAGGVPIFPYASDVLAVADDETFSWDVINQIESGAWQAIMYNTGAYAHTIYIYFTVQLPPPATTRLSARVLPAVVLGSSTPTPAPATLPGSPATLLG